jgi:uncharacterized membrane protein YvlD (DUF360 family)
MKKILSQIVSAILGLWISTIFISGVVVKVYPESNFFGYTITAQWQMFLILGIIFGLLNYFIKPLLRKLMLPLEIITGWILGILLSCGFLWFLDKIFDEFYVPWFLPIIYTTLIVYIINLILQKFLIRNYYE